jgi:hypothetical protein
MLLIPAVALIGFGVEGLYHAFRGRDQTAIDCVELTRRRPPSYRLLVTGCEIDYAGSGFRESGGQIKEIFLPARPASAPAQGFGAARPIPAPIVVATDDPDAIAIAEKGLRGRVPAPEESIAIMQSVAATINATGAISGLARTGLMERVRARRILSGLNTSIASNALIVDEGGTPDYFTPLLALGAGLLLAALPFRIGGGVRSAPARTAPFEPLEPPAFVFTPPSPLAAAPVRPVVRATPAALPRLLLLNLDGSAGPDSIEAAPALGVRRDVIAMLSGAIPDLTVDDTGRVLSRPDSIRIDLGSQDPVATAAVDARGEAGVVLVKEILLTTGWRAFAPKTGLFVTIDDLTAIGALAANSR